jgi:SAM-dependent methyltransferase
MMRLPDLLFAPKEFWELSAEARKVLTNGCGPGGWLRWLVPDRNYGLDISPVCDIHDYMYAVGQTEEEREEADSVMLNNHLRLIDAKTKWQWLRRLRYRRAVKYYEAVKNYGGPFFWHGKNPVGTMQPVLA